MVIYSALSRLGLQTTVQPSFDRQEIENRYGDELENCCSDRENGGDEDGGRGMDHGLGDAMAGSTISAE